MEGGGDVLFCGAFVLEVCPLTASPSPVPEVCPEWRAGREDWRAGREDWLQWGLWREKEVSSYSLLPLSLRSLQWPCLPLLSLRSVQSHWLTGRLP
jgi:hypothetical protein